MRARAPIATDVHLEAEAIGELPAANFLLLDLRAEHSHLGKASEHGCIGPSSEMHTPNFTVLG